MNNGIIYLERADLDVLKWDACLEHAGNGLIYGYSFYLDSMAENWSALVWGDYEVVMPLVWKRKYGLTHIYQPPFSQRLGIFGNNVSRTLADRFIARSVELFRYINMAVSFRPTHALIQTTQRTNYIIPLSTDYSMISASYTRECHRNIRKAEARGCVFTPGVEISAAIGMYRQAYGKLHPELRDSAYKRLEALCSAASAENRLVPCAITEQETGRLLFSAVLFSCSKRIYYILGSPSAEGRKARATYFFIDQVLRRFAGTDKIFDFEGSDTPAVAAFYERFGPSRESYFTWHLNRLPWPANWLSRPR